MTISAAQVAKSCPASRTRPRGGGCGSSPRWLRIFSITGKKGYTAADVLLMERRTLRSGSQKIKVTVDRQRAFVGVDPYNKRIDRNSDDNLARVQE